MLKTKLQNVMSFNIYKGKYANVFIFSNSSLLIALILIMIKNTIIKTKFALQNNIIRRVHFFFLFQNINSFLVRYRNLQNQDF